MLALFNRANVARVAKSAAKGTAYLTTFSAVTYWAASEDVRRREELEKANPNCKVETSYVTVSGCGFYAKHELVPKNPKNKEEQQAMNSLRKK